jgi:hypothetical protein
MRLGRVGPHRATLTGRLLLLLLLLLARLLRRPRVELPIERVLEVEHAGGLRHEGRLVVAVGRLAGWRSVGWRAGGRSAGRVTMAAKASPPSHLQLPDHTHPPALSRAVPPPPPPCLSPRSRTVCGGWPGCSGGAESVRWMS